MEMSIRIQYASFLVRLWRYVERNGRLAEWESEVEHIQSGEQWSFHTLAELEAFLDQNTADPTGLKWTEVGSANRN